MKKVLLALIICISSIAAIGQTYVVDKDGGLKLLDTSSIPNFWQKVRGVQTTTSPRSVNVVLFGQSNSGTFTTWTWANVPATNPRCKAFKYGSYAVANPSLNNIVTGFGYSNVRNNLGFQMGLIFCDAYPNDSFFIHHRSKEATGSWLYSPATTGPGEVTSSNSELDADELYLDSIPTSHKIDLVVIQQGESDTGNVAYWRKNICEFIRRISQKPIFKKNTLFLIVQPANVAVNAGIRNAVDSMYYTDTKPFIIDTLNIGVVRHKIGTWDGLHIDDTGVTQLAKMVMSRWDAGGHDNAEIIDTSKFGISFFKKGAVNTIYREPPVLFGATSHANNTYAVQISTTGQGASWVARRTDNGNNGGEQTIRCDLGNDLTGSDIAHYSKRRATYAVDNIIRMGDTAILIVDSAGRSNVTNGNNGNYFSNVPSFFRVSQANGSALHVNSSGTSTGDGGALDFGWGSTVAGVNSARLRSESSSPGGGGLGIYTAPDNSTLTKAIFIDKSQRVAVGSGVTAADASAALDVQSTTGGVLMPRMNVTQAGALSSPANGLIIYVTNTDATFTSVGFWGRENGAWVKL